MMNESHLVVNDGIYPAMITPYRPDRSIDLEAVRELVNWYGQMGCNGIFAACTSSEVSFLSLAEREKLVRTVVETAPPQMDVVACGHVADDFDEQIQELKVMAACGVKAVVIQLNRLVSPSESDDLLCKRLEQLVARLPDDIYLGIYESPVPYKRFATDELLRFCVESGRFIFMKDTSCRISVMKRRLEIMKGSPMKLFNANSATFYESIALGAAGFCGVMGNFHPHWYRAILDLHGRGRFKEAMHLQDLVGIASVAQNPQYPMNAKYYLKLLGLPIQSCFCRNREHEALDESTIKEIESGQRVSQYLESLYIPEKQWAAV